MNENVARTGLIAALIVGFGAAALAGVVVLGAKTDPAAGPPASGPVAVAHAGQTVAEAAPQPPASLPGPKPWLDSPEVARALESIRLHAWWATSPQESAIEQIISKATDHGEGFVFVSKSAESVWASSIDIGLRGTPQHDWINHSSVFSLARNVPAIQAIGQPLIVMFMQPPRSRYSRAEAIYLLQDMLNLPDSAMTSEKNREVFDKIMKMKLPEDGRVRQRR